MCPSPERSTRFPWWQLPTFLGIDAPCVVLTWTWAVSRTTTTAEGLQLHVKPATAMFLVVWLIYLLDRMIDVARCQESSLASGRLKFARRYPFVYYGSMGICCVGVAMLIGLGLPREVLFRGGLVAIGVAIHFLIFVLPLFREEKLPGKEFGVGFFFSLGIVACLGYAPPALPLLIAVAALVAFNCLVIASADIASDRANDPGGASRWWNSLSRDIYILGWFLLVGAVGCGLIFWQLRYFSAIALSTLLLVGLHAARHHFSADTVRAFADYALLTPLIIWPCSTSVTSPRANLTVMDYV
jgi:hypothetical protein